MTKVYYGLSCWPDPNREDLPVRGDVGTKEFMENKEKQWKELGVHPTLCAVNWGTEARLFAELVGDASRPLVYVPGSQEVLDSELSGGALLAECGPREYFQLF